MPELPEVAALAQHLNGLCSGRLLVTAELAAVNVLKTFDPPLSTCSGRRVVSVERRGKYLCWQFEGPLWLVMHLARAGWLRWYDQIPTTPARLGRGPLELRLVFAADTGEPIGRCDMTEAGTRKSCAVHVVGDPAAVPGIARLGPDPLAADFTLEVLGGILRGAGRSQLKGVLRDQAHIAGIGNAYSDEILHAAGLSPFKAANSLTAPQLQRLHEQMRAVLTAAVEQAVALPMTELKDGKRAAMRVHGRVGKQCPVCGDTIREVSFADSALHYCPGCQTGGRPLADRRIDRLLK